MAKETIINAKLSVCCNFSVSFHFKHNEKISTCNKCNKACEYEDKPYWTLTDKLKYKNIK